MVSQQQKDALIQSGIDLFNNHKKDIIVDAIRHVYLGGFYSNPLEKFSTSEDFTKAVAGATTYALSSGSGIGRYAGAIMAPTGQIYLVPFNADQICRVVGSEFNGEFFGNFTGLGKWMGGCLTATSRIFLAAFNSNTFLEINPANDTFVEFGNFPGEGKWSGCYTASQSTVFAIPYNSDQVLRIIPNTRSTNTIAITNNPTGVLGKWRGAVSTADMSKVIGAPFNTNRILVIVAGSGTAEAIDVLPPLPQGAFSGAVMGPDGLVYFIPYNAGAIFSFNTVTLEVRQFGKFPEGGRKWMGGKLAPNGKIYCIPFDHPSILEIDPLNQEVRYIGSFEGEEKWMGGILTREGNILSVPYSADDALSILGAGVTGPYQWTLAGPVNNF